MACAINFLINLEEGETGERRWLQKVEVASAEGCFAISDKSREIW